MSGWATCPLRAVRIRTSSAVTAATCTAATWITAARASSPAMAMTGRRIRPPRLDEPSRLTLVAPEVSVVIPTQDRPDALAAVGRALAGQTMAPERFEVIVVDDGSGSPQRLDDVPAQV